MSRQVDGILFLSKTMKRALLLFSIFFLLTSFIEESVAVFRFGRHSCRILISGRNKVNAVFIALHENENTSVLAFKTADTAVSQSVLVRVKQVGERLIRFDYKGKDYLFDPNRIFTPVGIRKTLITYNEESPSGLEKNISTFADSLVKLIEPKTPDSYVVALHNNTNNGFSVLSFVASPNALEAYVSPSQDIDNFFIVTEREDFDFFKSIDRNVVLQNEQGEDDGSLSVYCQKKNIPYINVEAQIGAKTQQRKMIQEAYRLIQSKSQPKPEQKPVDPADSTGLSTRS